MVFIQATGTEDPVPVAGCHRLPHYIHQTLEAVHYAVANLFRGDLLAQFFEEALGAIDLGLLHRLQLQ